MEGRIYTIWPTVVVIFALMAGSAHAVEYTHIWIDQEKGVNRSDTPGTQEQPFKSITYAFERAEYLGRPDPWYVHIGPGVYDSNSVKPQNEQEAFPMVILSSIGCFAGGLTVLLSVPGIIGGIALLRYKPWARVLVLVMSAIGLLNIPIGTGMGIYSFWVLTRDETDELFS